MSISFSIVTPVYNRSDTIKRCIESVLRQSFVDFEHIIVDDGSTDNSFQIAQTFAAKDNRIKVFRFDENKGTNAGRNYSISKATKKYIIILDSDDYFTENALNIITNTIKSKLQFKHYLFAADDMISYYEGNEYLKKDNNIIYFKQWLSKEITGDFIHVVDRNLMALFPFNEYIRILEGTNFLRIYKQEKKQFYTKQIVTIRERDRFDSVTLTASLNDKSTIERAYFSILQRIEWFANDMVTYGLKDLLYKDCHVAIKLGLALSDYKKVRTIYNQFNLKLDFKEKIIYKLKLGKFLLVGIIIYYKLIKK